MEREIGISRFGGSLGVGILEKVGVPSVNSMGSVGALTRSDLLPDTHLWRRDGSLVFGIEVGD